MVLVLGLEMEEEAVAWEDFESVDGFTEEPLADIEEDLFSEFVFLLVSSEVEEMVVFALLIEAVLLFE